MSSVLNRIKLGAAVALLIPALACAQTRTITFDAGGAGGALAVGAILSNQYAGVGVTFAPNGFSGAGGPTGAWATNTNLTVVSSAGTDVGGLGTPSLVSGNLLRSFNGWLGENGDPSFRMTFSDAFIDFVQMDFAGIATASSTRMFVYSGATLLSTQTATGPNGQQRLSFSALAGQYITQVIVTPGDFNDWVGVDNITYRNAPSNVVPEPGTWALMSTGLMLLGGIAARRRRTAATV